MLKIFFDVSPSITQSAARVLLYKLPARKISPLFKKHVLQDFLEERYELLIHMHGLMIRNLFISTMGKKFQKQSREGLLVKKLLPIGVLTLVILIPLSVQVAFSDPGIAPGVLTHVYYPDGTEVPSIVPGGDGLRWIVVPGGSYKVNITNVELADGTTTVWIKGKTNGAIAWTIELTDQTISGGDIITDVFEIPENAGCTIVVAYWRIGHLAQDPIKPGMPAHMKTYYNDIPPHEDSEMVPCEKLGVPEFTLSSAIVVLLGLLAAYVVRRRHKML